MSRNNNNISYEYSDINEIRIIYRAKLCNVVCGCMKQFDMTPNVLKKNLGTAGDLTSAEE